MKIYRIKNLRNGNVEHLRTSKSLKKGATFKKKFETLSCERLDSYVVVGRVA